MVSTIRLERLFYGVIFLGLWGIFVVINRDVIGAEFPYLDIDFEDGNFSIGLNWVTFESRRFVDAIIKTL
jgi:hypothetical protein